MSDLHAVMRDVLLERLGEEAAAELDRLVSGVVLQVVDASQGEEEATIRLRVLGSRSLCGHVESRGDGWWRGSVTGLGVGGRLNLRTRRAAAQWVVDEMRSRVGEEAWSRGCG